MKRNHLTVKQASWLSGCTENYMREIIKQGKIPGCTYKTGPTGKHTFNIPLPSMFAHLGITDENEKSHLLEQMQNEIF